MEKLNLFINVNFVYILTAFILYAIARTVWLMRSDHIDDKEYQHLSAHLMFKGMALISVLAYMAYGDDPTKTMYWFVPFVLFITKVIWHLHKEEQECAL